MIASDQAFEPAEGPAGRRRLAGGSGHPQRFINMIRPTEVVRSAGLLATQLATTLRSHVFATVRERSVVLTSRLTRTVTYRSEQRFGRSSRSATTRSSATTR